MKSLRWHTKKSKDTVRSVKAFVLPENFGEKVALFLRGYRRAYLPYISVPWWVKSPKPKRWLLDFSF
jgi:hypothetical protein